MRPPTGGWSVTFKDLLCFCGGEVWRLATQTVSYAHIMCSPQSHLVTVRSLYQQLSGVSWFHGSGQLCPALPCLASFSLVPHTAHSSTLGNINVIITSQAWDSTLTSPSKSQIVHLARIQLSLPFIPISHLVFLLLLSRNSHERGFFAKEMGTHPSKHQGHGCANGAWTLSKNGSSPSEEVSLGVQIEVCYLKCDPIFCMC